MADNRKRSDSTVSLPPLNLSLAVGAALAAPAGSAWAQDDSGADAGVLEEVLVTARKRTESLMDIPESIQAISEQQIKQAGLFTMDDYARFIPSMSYVSTNPGFAKIIFRGIADDAATFIAEPSAALYLDEQSLVLNDTPDPRMVDIERVEALSGPQGTLYGASAQAGTLRIITNKPNPEGFEAFLDATLKGGRDSDMSYDLSGMVNIPINDSFAVRLVGFTAEDGGFIDVVRGRTLGYVPTEETGIERYDLAFNDGAERSNYNDVETKGGRLSARWLMSDSWTATAGIVYQDTRSNGRPERDPTLDQDLAVVRFLPDHEFDEQDWTQYALTLEGDLGWADFVSATSYFTRDWTYHQDTSVGYAAYFGTFCYDGYYYAYSNYTKYCFQPAGVGNYYNDPIGYLENIQKNTKFSQEFRLSRQGERFDWVAGLFYETAEEDWDFFSRTFGYAESKSMLNYLDGRITGEPLDSQNVNNFWWASYDRTDWEQWAVFGELTWHITDRWDATLGGRWFTREIDKIYWVEQPRGEPNGDISMSNSDIDDVVPKFNLSYQATDDILIYGLYSEGFRPGGTNRNRGLSFFPLEFESDFLENIEFGAKMDLASGRVRTTITYFDMSWDDYQLEVVDPSNRNCGSEAAPPEPFCGQPWQKVVANVGKASSKGVELQFDARATEQLTLGFNATWLDATLDEDVEVSVVIPAGSTLPLSPDWKGSAYAQMNWEVNWFGGWATDAYARLQWSYVDKMNNIVEPLVLYEDGPSPQLVQPAYNIGDFKFGFNADEWSIQLFVNNLTDERAILFKNPYEFDYFFGRGRETVNRPREYGMRLIKYFR